MTFKCQWIRQRIHNHLSKKDVMSDNNLLACCINIITQKLLLMWWWWVGMTWGWFPVCLSCVFCNLSLFLQPWLISDNLLISFFHLSKGWRCLMDDLLFFACIIMREMESETSSSWGKEKKYSRMWPVFFLWERKTLSEGKEHQCIPNDLKW